MCYTSGTTGNPKGVLYSHRSTMLHTMASALPDALNLSARDVILPVVPMFHVNAWGLPYVAPMVGAKIVFPGPHLDGKSLYELFESEKVTFSAGVPTVWQGLARVHGGEQPEIFDDESHGDRRLGVPARDDQAVSGKVRRAGTARVGHDRDEPAGHCVHLQAQAHRSCGPSSGCRCSTSRAGRCSASI